KEGAVGRLYEDNIGYFWTSGINVGHTSQYLGIFTSAFRSGNGVNIYEFSLDRVLVSFSARNAVTVDWVNGKDNISRPDEAIINANKDLWSEYINDALILSLFSNQSYQASYRGTSSYN